MTLGILTGMPSVVSARSKIDSLVMNRIYNYRRNYTHDMAGYTTNVYMRNTINVRRRNSALWVIPTMYTIAKGNRSHVSESYNRFWFESLEKYERKQQVLVTTIRHNRKTLPTLSDFLTPNLYDMLIFRDHVLSPFHRKNRFFYKYGMVIKGDGTVTIFFKPRLTDNTQLVKGKAVIVKATGRIKEVDMEGEFDMIRFHTVATLGDDDRSSLLPKQCRTDVDFKFLGNRIQSTFEAMYDCPVTLPDSVDNSHSRALMDSLRPYPLTNEQELIYAEYDREHPSLPPDTAKQEPSKPRRQSFGDFMRHEIGDNLVTSIRAKSENYYFKLSPILNPQYLSYSHSRGLSYKMKIGAKYYFNTHRYFEFDPNIGYNFKIKKLYFTAPLRFNYNPKRDGYVEVVYGNGNRITNSSVIDEIEDEHGDTISFSNRNLEYFDDNYMKVTNNIMAFDWIDIEGGLTIHRRNAVNPEEMQRLNKPASYRSFAPVLSLKIRPWVDGPLFTLDYERGIKGINKSNIGYERWEFDASTKYKFHMMRKFNLRVGGGFYSMKEDNYFVDFANFRDNNLPEGWDDEWTGNFQLLRSKWYNSSSYYARCNVSYESPLFFATWIPFFGRYIETERIYLSTLSIDHTRLYNEVGYGFTNRAFSIGLFASFLSTHFQSAECKFTIELFRRW